MDHGNRSVAPDGVYPSDRFTGGQLPPERNTKVQIDPNPANHSSRTKKRSPRNGIGDLALNLLIVTIVALSWSVRNEHYLTAEEGLGYELGIIGSVMMLVLLLYPLRKRIRSLSWLGRVPIWFRIHMAFGALGPALVLMHSNFQIGSTNSTVALFSMLTVAGSGFIGRYLYGRIHHGLYGRKAKVEEIIDEAGTLKQLVGADPADHQILNECLQEYETWIASRRGGLFANLLSVLTFGAPARVRRHRLTKRLRKTINQSSKRNGWSRKERRQHMAAATGHLDDFFIAVHKAVRFRVYERFFALWHVLHLPLFFFLILTATIHVVAVHLY